MTQKTDLVQTRVSPASKLRFQAVAAEHDLSPSAFLRQVIETISGAVEAPDRMPTRALREGKVTVRLREEVRLKLEQEAQTQHVPTSTWAARLLTARMRSAPQPVQGERKPIQHAFRQLRGMATNLNQIATVMNRGVFTGDSYAPTKGELQDLRRDVQALRLELAKYAGGRFAFQTGGEVNDE